MAIEVELPDGSVVEFPDGTPNQVMEAALKQHANKVAPNPASAPDSAARVPGNKPQSGFDRFRDAQRKRSGISAGSAVASTVIDFADATQHHLMNPINGVAQGIEHGLEWAAENTLGADNAVTRSLRDDNARADRGMVNREADYQSRTPDGAGSYAGAAVGEIAPWMYGLGQLRAAGYLPQIAKGQGLGGIARRGGLLALEGGTMGLAQPVTGEGSYAGQKAAQVATGAVAAPVIATGAAGLGATVRGGVGAARYLTNAGRDKVANARLAKLLGGDPETVAQLRAPSGVPGFEPTPAMALATPEAVQAERVLRNNGNTAPAFAARDSANNAVLRQTVANVAGAGDAAMEGAKSARRAATQPFREQYLPEEGSPLVDASSVTNLLKKLTLSGNDTVRQAARKHLSLLEEHAAQNGGKISAYALDDIRQGVGSTLRSIPQHGAVTPKETVIYGSVSSAITDALERAIPGYRNHLATYARASQPINDMEAGRTLLAAIDSGGRDAGGNQAVSLTQVKALLSKDNRAEFPMSDGARAQIEAVLEALQKRSVANNNIAASGPGTGADVQRAIQASPILMRLLGHGASVGGGMTLGPLGYLAGAGMTEAATAANNSVARKVGQKAASASSAADAIEAHMRQQPNKPNALWQLMLPYTQPPRR